MFAVWEENGQGIVEYAFILVLIALFSVMILALFGENLGRYLAMLSVLSKSFPTFSLLYP
ncbi:MAG: hypothetical protein MAG431_01249 [Chloroflexi bacterium]|nr:hypothetical protein [Chloroflexota bacterium]